MGIAFERAIALALPQVRRGQWFDFTDAYGQGYCQTDFIFKYDGAAYVIEAKLKDTPAAYHQLLDLYIPIVGRAYGLPTFGIVVVKHLDKDANDYGLLCHTLGFALKRVAEGIPTVHWLGRGAL